MGGGSLAVRAESGLDRWRAYDHFTTNLLAAIRQEPA
jgi:hypothetical protein